MPVSLSMLFSASSTDLRPQAMSLLSYSRPDTYRQNFSHEMNTMRKDLADADAVFDRLRQSTLSPGALLKLWPTPRDASSCATLYLSGNGAVIFGNSFVEWAASEAFRRARPCFLAARFGIRSQTQALYRCGRLRKS